MKIYFYWLKQQDYYSSYGVLKPQFYIHAIGYVLIVRIFRFQMCIRFNRKLFK